MSKAWCPTEAPWVRALCAPPRRGDISSSGTTEPSSLFQDRTGYSECFEDVVLFGAVHVVMFALVLGAQRGSLNTSFEPFLHKAVVGLSGALTVAFVSLLVERVVVVGLAYYELIGYGACALTWTLTSCSVLTKIRYESLSFFTSESRFIIFLSGVPMVARARTLFLLRDVESQYFIALNVVVIGLFALLWVVGLIAFWPWRSRAQYEALVGSAGVEDRSSTEGLPHPHPHASLLGKITYAWCNALLSIGYKRQLRASDIYEIEPDMRTEVVRVRWMKAWKENNQDSVAVTSFQIFRGDMLRGMILKVLYDVSSFAPPLLLNELLLWMQEDPYGKASNCTGFVLTSLMVFFTLMMPLLENIYFYHMFRMGSKSRSMLTDAVQRKSLSLHPRAREEMGSGAIINHMTIDSETLGNGFYLMNNIWSAPIRIVAAILLLYNLLGYAAFIGLGSLLVVLPLQGWAAKLFAKFRAEALALSDQRIKAVSELVSGIRIVKFYAWEQSSLERIFNIRTQELAVILKMAYANTVSIAVFDLNPVLLAVVTFTIFSFYKSLTPNVAFTALALINAIRFPMMTLPETISDILEARVSLQRLSTFLKAEELGHVSPGGAPQGTVQMSDVSVTYKKDAPPTISHVSLKVPPGSLTCIIGRTGAGKSTLLASLVGDIEISGGTLTVDGSVAFASQQAWITNDTVEANITFGSPSDPSWLQTVVAACQLEDDIALWKGGLQTEIGERGLNLSGGQKQRVSIARAVYADTDIVILDDPLCALDARVCRLVFDVCIDGILRSKTRILVTHQMQFLSRMDWIVLMEDGIIIAQGTYQDLSTNSEPFQAFTKAQQRLDEKKCGAIEGREGANGGSSVEGDMKVNVGRSINVDAGEGAVHGLSPSHGADDDGNMGRLCDEEHREYGTALTPQHIGQYISAAGGTVVVVGLLVLLLFGQLVMVGSSWWLAQWSGADEKAGSSSSTRYVLIFGAFGIGQFVSEVATAFFVAKASNRAAKKLHDTLLHNLVALPMSFFDTNPSGRVINRLTKDQGEVDEHITSGLTMLLQDVFVGLGIIGALFWASPVFIVVVIPVLVAFYFIQVYYRHSVREVKRLESTSRSPIYSFFSETATGVGTIRAYKKQDYVLRTIAGMLDYNQKFNLAETGFSRWMNMRLEGLGTFVVAVVAIVIILEREKLGPGLVGFALSYAFSLTTMLGYIIWDVCRIERSFTSVERLLEYAALPTERAQGTMSPSKEWPSRGEISFDHVSMAYRPGCPLVLHDVTFHIPSGKKVGIVGRTGAGKSSLLVALYRMAELHGGTIRIDGVDIAALDLPRLRRSLTIIPQEPIIFSGTVRSNLDPFSTHTDAEVKEALRRAHLPGLALDNEVAEHGVNFSVGQRQLMCLARALLVRSSILVMDEVTASVDPHTDRLVQDTIDTQFATRTKLIIAHRLTTIVNSDWILVFDNGRVVESGLPQELAGKRGGHLRALLEHDEGRAAESHHEKDATTA